MVTGWIGEQTAGEWLEVLYRKNDLQDFFVNYENFNSVCYFHDQTTEMSSVT